MGKCLYQVFIEMPDYEKHLRLYEKIIVKTNPEHPTIILARQKDKECFVVRVEVEIKEKDTEEELKVRSALFEPCVKKVMGILNIESKDANIILHRKILDYRLVRNGGSD